MTTTGGFSFPPDPKTKHIIKFPLGDEDECTRCGQEREVYQRLELSPYPRPCSLFGFHGSTGHGILLEYAERGPVRQMLHESLYSVPLSTVLRWAQQAAEALQFIHANGICHGDVNCTNFFLGEYLDLKVSDFISAFDNSPATPQAFQEDISNYGSALYEIVTGHLPYEYLSEDEREQRFIQKHIWTLQMWK
ncbi:kinase-like domain-containing protein [Aspergillus californicus]